MAVQLLVMAVVVVQVAAVQVGVVVGRSQQGGRSVVAGVRGHVGPVLEGHVVALQDHGRGC